MGATSAHIFDAEHFLGLQRDLHPISEEVTNSKDIDVIKQSTFRPADFNARQGGVAEYTVRRSSEEDKGQKITREKCDAVEEKEEMEMHMEAAQARTDVTDVEAPSQTVPLPRPDLYSLLRSLLSLFIRSLADLEMILSDEFKEPSQRT